MKLKEISLIAEIVSGIAIVVTLLILIFEVRANTANLEISNRQSIAIRAQELALTLVEDRELNEALFRVMRGHEISEEMILPATAFIQANLRLAEESYGLYLDGVLAEEYWQSRVGVILTFLQSDRVREEIRQNRTAGIYTESFSSWLDQAFLDASGE